MTRPARIRIDASALLHNIKQIKQLAPGRGIIAMVKANAYGCGLNQVVPMIAEHVDALGIACMEEALAIRALGVMRDCVLIQGVFSADEYLIAAQNQMSCVIHHQQQLDWFLATPLAKKIKIWVKVNTGMHRLGFQPDEVPKVMQALINCRWADEIGLLTHLACADVPDNQANAKQLKAFQNIKLPSHPILKSIANSAAIIALPDAHADVIRPGIMLYGVSPFAHQTGQSLGLMPVMSFVSAISAIHHYPKDSAIGYSATWITKRPSMIAVVAVGYGDGYPRHIAAGTPVWVNGQKADIVGRISMDMLTIDITDCQGIEVGTSVELWGKQIPIETIAKASGTIAYELLCQITNRPRG